MRSVITVYCNNVQRETHRIKYVSRGQNDSAIKIRRKQTVCIDERITLRYTI